MSDVEEETVVDQEEATIAPEEVQEEDNIEEVEQIPTEDEQESLVVTIGDEETPPQEDKEAPEWVKDLRKQQRETAKENKRLKRELEQRSEQSKVKALPDKPTLASCDYDETEFEKQLFEYNNIKQEVEKQEQSKVEQAKKQEEEWQSTLNTYNEQKESLKVKDYGESEATVESEFNQQQQVVLLNATQNPALVVYALGKNEKALKDLSKITDPVKFAAAIARLETTMKTNRKKSVPNPEKKVSGGGNLSSGSDKTLERLRKEAEKSGDFSKVMAHKKSLKQ